MKTKTKRIINGAVAIGVAIPVITMVCVEWHKMGCGVNSLVAAIAMYTTFAAAIWNTVDTYIVEKEEA